MPKTCNVCKHKDRKEIDRRLVERMPLRDISRHFGPSRAALDRHINTCLPKLIAKYRGVQRSVRAEIDVIDTEIMREHAEEQVRKGVPSYDFTVESVIGRIFEGVMKLYDACDRELTDPNDETVYSLDPRTRTDRIIWQEPDGKGGFIKKSGTLQEALDLAFPKGCERRFVRMTKYPDQDIPMLLLKTTDRLSANAELLADLEGRFRKVEKEMGENNTIQLSVIENILRQAGMLSDGR
jgi:hypothetical protein